MANILLAGLDGEIQREFSGKLAQLGHSFTSQHGNKVSAEMHPDVVLASGDDAPYYRRLRALRAANPALPVVLVSRVASDESWLTALEAGATDYCASGIDTENLRWIINGATRAAGVRIASAAA